MNELLFHYHRPHPVTWVYLSSLMTIALYFKFNRFWSIRNLDLVGLILFAPGLLLIEYGRGNAAAGVEQIGYTWMFAVSALFLLRLLVDPLMVRRPLLEPNMTGGALTFVGGALLIFLMANVVTSNVTAEDMAGPRLAQQLRNREIAADEKEVEESGLDSYGPGYPLLFLVPNISTQRFFADEGAQPETAMSNRQDSADAATAKTMAILSHLAIVLGIVLIGYRHFDNIKTGIAAATLYLLLPYTAMFTGRVHHVLPAALLVWAVVTYRRPLASGMLMGLAIGTSYFPAFLLPLWISFYWERGLVRFVGGVLAAIGILVATLAFRAPDWAAFVGQLKWMFGLRAPLMEGLSGFWQFDAIDPIFRLPVIAAFAALCGSFAIWPAQKNLGTLMSCSAAIMLGTQFWHARGGGLYIAWYMPLLLLTIFRPNLEDRVALSVLGEGWLPRRKQQRQSLAA